jgi:hypothetical protein
MVDFSIVIFLIGILLLLFVTTKCSLRTGGKFSDYFTGELIKNFTRTEWHIYLSSFALLFIAFILFIIS